MAQTNLFSRLCSELAHNLVAKLFHANTNMHLTLTPISNPASGIILSCFPEPSKDIPQGAFSEIAAVGLEPQTATM